MNETTEKMPCLQTDPTSRLRNLSAADHQELQQDIDRI